MGAEKKKSAAKAPAKKAEVKPVSKATPKPAAAKAPAKAAAKPAAKAAPKSAPQKAASPAKNISKAPAKKPVAKAATRVTKSVKAQPAKSLPAPEAHSFPPEYLVLMQKDPNWMHAFWDVSDERVQQSAKKGRKLVLRLYDVSADLTVRSNKRRFRDIEVPAGARSWYLQNSSTGSVQVSLGTVDGKGGFQPLLDSSKVSAFGPSGEELGSADSIFMRASLGGIGVDGFGSSALSIPGHTLSSVSPSSWSLSSFTGSSESMVHNVAGDRGKDFFLWVKTRLIVYGGTRPDAHLQVRGQPFPLRPDGTFSLEMDLPDSTQIIPVFATDHEGDFPTTIVPIVVKRTE